MFYNRRIASTYDLKGSQRARKASVELQQNNVLLDENLLEQFFANPLCINPESKSLLGMSVWNDSLFLSMLSIMDYSLLVGVDADTGELVYGIIGPCLPLRRRRR